MGGPLHVLLLELLEKIDGLVYRAIQCSAVLIVPELVYGARLCSSIGPVCGGCVRMCRGIPSWRARHQRVAHRAACHGTAVSGISLEELLEMRGMFGGRAGTNGHVAWSREPIRIVRDVIGICRRRLIVGSSRWGLALAGEVILTHVRRYVSIGGWERIVGVDRERGSRLTLFFDGNGAAMIYFGSAFHARGETALPASRRGYRLCKLP